MIKITERQYKIILGQAFNCYPQETGGILGGREDTVLGVLPILNKEFSDPKKQYGITTEDLERARAFLQKNKLEFIGLYHTHPKGIAYPSAQDLAHKMPYMFIVGLSDHRNPEFAAYKIQGASALPVPISIISDKGFTVAKLHEKKHKLSESLPEKELGELYSMIDDYINRKLTYKKDKPIKWDSSTFSTRA